MRVITSVEFRDVHSAKTLIFVMLLTFDIESNNIVNLKKKNCNYLIYISMHILLFLLKFDTSMETALNAHAQEIPRTTLHIDLIDQSEQKGQIFPIYLLHSDE